MGSRFSCVISGMDRVFLDLLQAVENRVCFRSALCVCVCVCVFVCVCVCVGGGGGGIHNRRLI